MILLIDNYDSFVYNLARYIKELGFETIVKRNDCLTITDIQTLNPEKIIISPGPCDPDHAGISMEVIRVLGKTIPILGVCLGHQAIGQVFGGKVGRALKPVHGKASMITHNGRGLFQGIQSPLRVGRYHSLIVEKEGFPEALRITAESSVGEIMALAHKKFPIFGVQFHPESVSTEDGYHLLYNFLIINLDSMK